jgi:hypothetical protein
MILENGEYDLTKLFGLIAELGESLNENRNLSVALYTQATNVKVCLLCSSFGGCGGSHEVGLVGAGDSFTVRVCPPKVHVALPTMLFPLCTNKGLNLCRFNLDKTQGLGPFVHLWEPRAW